MISLVDTDASGIDLRCGSSRLLLFHGVVSFMTADSRAASGKHAREWEN